ncbi:MAG: hypothetical protein GXP30_10710 [Verrucomicrobia bacterium]|nr:hypothetical protein [Verrucomicrobiota bacterium]
MAAYADRNKTETGRFDKRPAFAHMCMLVLAMGSFVGENQTVEAQTTAVNRNLRILAQSQKAAAAAADAVKKLEGKTPPSTDKKSETKTGDAKGKKAAPAATSNVPAANVPAEQPGPAMGRRVGGGSRPGAGVGGVSLQFPLNPVSDILNIYERLVGKTIIKDTSVFDGPQISLVTPNEVSKEDAIRLIEASLITNGYVLIQGAEGKTVKVLRAASGKSPASTITEGLMMFTTPESLPQGDTLVAYYMSVNFMNPEEVGTIFANHVTLHSFGKITPIATPPGLLITENTAIIRQFIKLLAIIDVTPEDAPLLTEFVKLDFAEANVVAQIIQAAMDARVEESQRMSESGRTLSGQAKKDTKTTKKTPTRSTSSSQQVMVRTASGQYVRGTTQGVPMTGIGTADQPAAQLIPDDRLNRIMVVASPQDVAYILEMVKEFDQPLATNDILERPLNYVKANDILPVVVDLLQDTGTGQTILPGGRQIDTRPTPVTSSQLSALTGTQNQQQQTRNQTNAADDSGRPDQLAFPLDDVAPISVLVGKTRIIADRQANSIIIIGSLEAKKIVTEIIDILDRKPLQVYLATVIGQLQLEEGLEFGIDYLQRYTQFDSSNPARGGVAGSLFNSRRDVITNRNVDDLRNNVVTTPFGPADGLNVYGKVGDSLDVFITALENTDHFKVLSRPVIYTQNGKRAEITSGSKIPVPRESLSDTTNNVNTTAVRTTIDFEDVVLKLEVVPTINKDNHVTLDIVQVNDNVIGTAIVAGSEVPIIGTQELNTTVTVPHRTTIVLGGLIAEENNDTDTGVPFLGRIPILGYLVKNTRRGTKRSELLIFIQPTIVDDEMSLKAASRDEDARTLVGEDVARTFPEAGEPIRELKKEMLLAPQKPKKRRGFLWFKKRTPKEMRGAFDRP